MLCITRKICVVLEVLKCLLQVGSCERFQESWDTLLWQRVRFGNKLRLEPSLAGRHGGNPGSPGLGEFIVQIMRRERQSWKIYRITPENDSEGSFHPGSRLME